MQDLSANNGNLIYEQAGYLHIFYVNSETSKRLKINISTGLLELRERYVSRKNTYDQAQFLLLIIEIWPLSKKVNFFIFLQKMICQRLVNMI